jgi:hypothetical protein
MELSSEDFDLLKRVLTRYRSDLRMEIADTENADWRKDMHKDEDRAARLLELFENAQPGNAQPAAGQPDALLIVVRGFVAQV